MLNGLRHDPVVSGHDQKGEIDRPRTSQHVSNKTLMARHINNRSPLALTQLKGGVAVDYGDAPTLFLKKTVSVNTSQGQDQTGLAMIHVTSRAYNDMTRFSHSYTKSN
jgi:hypothetical protein